MCETGCAGHTYRFVRGPFPIVTAEIYQSGTGIKAVQAARVASCDPAAHMYAVLHAGAAEARDAAGAFHRKAALQSGGGHGACVTAVQYGRPARTDDASREGRLRGDLSFKGTPLDSARAHARDASGGRCRSARSRTDCSVYLQILHFAARCDISEEAGVKDVARDAESRDTVALAVECPPERSRIVYSDGRPVFAPQIQIGAEVYRAVGIFVPGVDIVAERLQIVEGVDPQLLDLRGAGIYGIVRVCALGALEPQNGPAFIIVLHVYLPDVREVPADVREFFLFLHRAVEEIVIAAQRIGIIPSGGPPSLVGEDVVGKSDVLKRAVLSADQLSAVLTASAAGIGVVAGPVVAVPHGAARLHEAGYAADAVSAFDRLPVVAVDHDGAVVDRSYDAADRLARSRDRTAPVAAFVDPRVVAGVSYYAAGFGITVRIAAARHGAGVDAPVGLRFFDLGVIVIEASDYASDIVVSFYGAGIFAVCDLSALADADDAADIGASVGRVAHVAAVLAFGHLVLVRVARDAADIFFAARNAAAVFAVLDDGG